MTLLCVHFHLQSSNQQQSLLVTFKFSDLDVLSQIRSAKLLTQLRFMRPRTVRILAGRLQVSVIEPLKEM